MTPARRQVILALGGAAAGAALGGLYRSGASGAGAGPLRPPGARSEPDFLAACIRCGLCIEACPHDALRAAGLAAGPAAGAPHVAPRTAPCFLCPERAEIPCIDACPSGALLPVADRAAIRMGTARLDETTCWAYTGTMCRACWHACPYPGAAIRLDERLRPVVDEARCVGCGLCEHACPTEPTSIAIEPAAPAGREPSS